MKVIGSGNGVQPYDSTREHLIELCEKAVVKKDLWSKPSSHEAQINLADIYGYLKADCDFECTIHADEIIWIEFNKVTKQQYIKARNTELNIDKYTPYDDNLYSVVSGSLIFCGERENYSLTDDFNKDDILDQYLLFYIPSEKRLKKCNGKDWC